MKKTIVLILLFALSACAGKHHAKPAAIETPPEAPKAEASAPMRQEIQMSETTALVLAVNHKTRMITLKTEDGKKTTFKAGKEVKRLNEIRKGDTVRAQVYKSLVLEVREPTKEEKRKPTTAILGAERSTMDLPPAVAAMREVHTIVNVLAIDREAETVRIKLPNGKKHTVHARDPKNLDLIKVGDTIAITYTEAVAISLEPTKKVRKK